MPEKETGKKNKKSIGQILRSDLSLRTFKDVLTYEIPLPYSRETVDKLKEVVSGEKASKEEVEKLVERLAREGERVLEILLEKGVISEEDAERVKEESARTGLSLPQTLVNLKLVSPDRIASLTREIQRDLEAKAGGESLEDILLEEKVIAEDALKKAKELAQEERISLEGAILATEGMKPESLSRVMKEHYGIEIVRPEKENPARAVVDQVPENLMKSSVLIPIRRSDKNLHLAMANPRNESLLDRVRLLTGLNPVPYLADPRAIRKLQRKFLVEVEKEAETSSRIGAEELAGMAETESTVRMVTKIIDGAVHARATDIHVESQESNLRVRYRIDGMLYDIMSIPEDAAAATISRLKVMAKMDITERRRPQDGHITADVDGNHVNLRVSTLPTQYGEKVVLRVLDYSSVMRGLTQLGMEDDQLEKFKSLIARPYGMVLVTGPMGAGKTTTLYAALGGVNSPHRNIVTIEDPIEYQLPGINQVQVDPKVNLNFATGLRAVLRQDANILMVGEIRDQETALVAARAASTGHLILSTLHTNSAVGAVTALRNLGVPPYVIANTLICVVAQRLVRRVCQACAKKRQIRKSESDVLGLPKNTRKMVMQAAGCDECYHTGFVGRTGIYEILQNTPGVMKLIADEKGEAEIRETALKEGFRPLMKNAGKKVMNKITTPEEVFRNVTL